MSVIVDDNEVVPVLRIFDSHDSVRDIWTKSEELIYDCKNAYDMAETVIDISDDLKSLLEHNPTMGEKFQELVREMNVLADLFRPVKEQDSVVADVFEHAVAESEGEELV